MIGRRADPLELTSTRILVFPYSTPPSPHSSDADPADRCYTCAKGIIRRVCLLRVHKREKLVGREALLDTPWGYKGHGRAESVAGKTLHISTDLRHEYNTRTQWIREDRNYEHIWVEIVKTRSQNFPGRIPFDHRLLTPTEKEKETRMRREEEGGIDVQQRQEQMIQSVRSDRSQ